MIEDYVMGGMQKSNRKGLAREMESKNSATLKTTCSVLCKDGLLLKLRKCKQNTFSA